MFFFFNDENNNSFEEIKHIDENGKEYWLARELQEVLGYAKWQNFENIIDKAKESCRNSGFSTLECFTDISKTSAMPNGGFKDVGDIMLNRYACYLIAQNGDPKKESIALAQTYFAVQTRRQELQDQFNQLTEDQRRLAIRGELIEHNKSLVEAAQQAGVETRGDFAKFQNRGYQGLYGGLRTLTIYTSKTPVFQGASAFLHYLIFSNFSLIFAAFFCKISSDFWSASSSISSMIFSASVRLSFLSSSLRIIFSTYGGGVRSSDSQFCSERYGTPVSSASSFIVSPDFMRASLILFMLFPYTSNNYYNG